MDITRLFSGAIRSPNQHVSQSPSTIKEEMAVEKQYQQQ